MNYKDFTKIANFMNNHGILSIMDKIAKEFDYDEYYTNLIVGRYYTNPHGFICTHDCGERLFELIWEEAQEMYGD